MKHQIHVAQQAQPFVPFEIELVGGRVLRIPHPEFIYIPPGKAPYFVYTHADGTPELCNAFMVLSVRPSRQRSSRSRKAG